MKKHVKRSAETLWSIWGSISLAMVLALLGLGIAGSIYGLRSNNLTMIGLRNQFIAADRDDGDVSTALADLRAHVTSHMNSDLSRDIEGLGESEKPLQRTHGYYRDALTAYQSLLADSAANTAVLNEAVIACQEADVTERLTCINLEVVDRGGENFPRLTPPSKDFYTYDFHSPRWSPDLAGFSLVVFAVSMLLLATRFVAGYIMGRILRH